MAKRIRLPCIFLWLVISAWVACDGPREGPVIDTPALAQAEAPQAGPSPSLRAQQQGGLPRLTRDSERVFSTPRPTGLTLISRDEDIARFSSDHPFGRLVDFYRHELRGYQVAVRRNAARFETDDHQRADVYVVLQPNNLCEITYLRSGLEDEYAQTFAGDESEPEREAQEVFARSYAWPQGYTALPSMIEASQQADGHTPQNPFYEEVIEERDGQTVRVLIPREADQQPDTTDFEATRNPPPTEPRIGARFAYDRGGGYRSLRSNPARGIDGEILPFRGSQPVTVSPGTPY